MTTNDEKQNERMYLLQRLTSQKDALLRFMANRGYALKASIWNVIAYCVSVGMPTFIDPRLEHRFEYLTRQYPMGWWVLAPSIAVAFLTFYFNVKTKKPTYVAILTWLSLIGPVYLTLPNFVPEVPHGFVTQSPLMFGLLIFAGTYIHYLHVDLDFLNGNSSPEQKIERLKMEHEAWNRYLLGIFAVYAAGVYSVYQILVINSPPIVTPSEAEQTLLGTALSIALALNVLCFLANPVRELAIKVSAIRKSMTEFG